MHSIQRIRPSEQSCSCSSPGWSPRCSGPYLEREHQTDTWRWWRGARTNSSSLVSDASSLLHLHFVPNCSTQLTLSVSDAIKLWNRFNWTHVWWSLCWERFSARWLWFPCPVRETREEKQTAEAETGRPLKLDVNHNTTTHKISIIVGGVCCQLAPFSKHKIVIFNLPVNPSSSGGTYLAGYLLKNSPELLVLLALFPRWGRRRLRRHGATKKKEIKTQEEGDVFLKSWLHMLAIFFTLQRIIAYQTYLRNSFRVCFIALFARVALNCSDFNRDLYAYWFKWITNWNMKPLKRKFCHDTFFSSLVGKGK